MKKITLIPIVLLMIHLSVKAQKKTGQKQKAVKQVLVNLYNGVANSNLEMIKFNCTIHFLMLQDTTVLNIELLTKKLLKRAPKLTTTNTLDFMKVNFKGKNAWVNYHNTVHITTADGRQYDIGLDESAILVKSKDRWLISELYSKTQKKS